MTDDILNTVKAVLAHRTQTGIIDIEREWWERQATALAEYIQAKQPQAEPETPPLEDRGADLSGNLKKIFGARDLGVVARFHGLPPTFDEAVINTNRRAVGLPKLGTPTNLASRLQLAEFMRGVGNFLLNQTPEPKGSLPPNEFITAETIRTLARVINQIANEWAQE